MIRNGVGGANTITGAVFEEKTNLEKALLKINGITIVGVDVFKKGVHIGMLLQKHKLYKNFLEKRNVNWKSIVSSKILPDDAYFSIATNKLTVIEKKYQNGNGSVDEKLQTCAFKLRQYRRLCASLPDVTVDYMYVLNDWFEGKKYTDVLAYIEEIGCSYYINELPLAKLGF